MSHEQIALALGIARNTLEKHFETELSTGAYQRRMEVLVALHAAAKKGNVSAAKAYAGATPEFLPPAEFAAAPPPPSAAPEAREATQPPKGKKERQHEEATVAQVGTDWEHLLPTNPSGMVQ
jgi:hypothetical protein